MKIHLLSKIRSIFCLTSCLVLFSIDIANASYSDVTGEKMLLLDFASKNPTWLHCNGTPVDAQIVNNALKLTSSGQGHCRMGVDAANRSFYTYLVVRMKSAVGGEQASIRFTNGYTDNNSNATPMVDVLATGSPAVLTTEYQDFYLINHNVASPNWNWDFAVYIDIAGVTLYIDEIFYTNTAPVPIITQEINSSAGDNFCEGTTTTLSVFGLTNTNYTWSQTSNGITTPMTEQGQTVSVLPLIGTTIYSVSDGIDTLTKTITVNRCCGNTVSDFSIAKICNPLTIDGIDNEVEWTMSPWVTIDKNHILDGDHDCSHGPGNVLQNPAGQWRSLYDENNIYFYVRVFDPSPQNGTNDYWKDAVEIYIGSNGVSRQFGFTYMPGYSPDGVNSGYYPHQEPRNNVGRIQTVSGVNGYWDLEVQIPIAVNNLDLNGETVRLEVAVNQSAGSNNCRSAQLFTWEAKNYYNANASELHLVSLSDCFSARASKDTVCNGGTTVLSATLEWVGENDFYIWEESADGTNWTNASFSGGDERYNYVTVTPTYNPTYYRALYNNFPSCPVQIIMQTVNVSASSAKTAYHPNEQMEIVGFTALTGDDVQWGWKKSSDSIITNAVWIPGYGLSNDVTKKTFVKTAQESDEGYYFFVVQKECEASSAPLLITVSLEDDPLYECINASDFYVQKICSTPIIDGLDTEIEWWTTPWVKVNKNHYLNGEHDCIQNSLGRPTSNPGGIWRAMYDDNYLYFFVRVYDSIPYNSSTGNGNSAHYWQDAVEVYIGNERQFGYTYNSNGIPFTYGSGVNKGNAAIVKSADSWDLEIRIPVGAGNNIDLSSDSLLMELAINQSIGTENCRIAQLFTWTAKNHYNDGGSLHTVPLSDCLLTHTSIQSSANTIECNETVVLTADVNSKDTTHYYMWQESVDGGQLWSSAEVYSGDSASNEITVKPLISKQYRAIIGNVATCPVLITVIGDCEEEADTATYTCPDMDPSQPHIYKVCQSPRTEKEWNIASWTSIDRNWANLNGDEDCSVSGGSCRREVLQSPAGQWKAVYDNDSIYFKVQVFDSVPNNTSTSASVHWWQDAVEIYINNQTQYGYTYNANGTPYTYGNGNNKGRATITKEADSWYLYVSIPVAGNNINLSSGSLLMEVAVNQSNANCNCRSAQIFTWVPRNHYIESGYLTPVALLDCMSTRAIIGSTQQELTVNDSISCGEEIMLNAGIMSSNPNHHYRWEESRDGGASWSQASVAGGDNVNNNVTVVPMIDNIQYRAVLVSAVTCPITINIEGGDCEEEADTATYTCPNVDPSQPHIYKVCQSPRTEKEWNIASWTSIDRNWANLNGDEDCSVSGGSCRREVLQSPAGQWKAVYDNDSIYFKVQVFDSVPNNTSTSASVHWWQDAVEIYINNQTQYGYTYNANGTPYTYGNGNNKGRATITKEADSWYLYVSIPVAGNNINLSSGSLLMEVAVNQSNANCNCRSAQIFTWVPRNHYIESGYLTPVALFDCMSTRAIIGSTQQELTVNDSISCGEEIMLNAGIMSSNPNHHYRWEESRDGGVSWSQASVAGGDNVNNNVTVVPMIDNIQYRAVLGSAVTCPITINIEGGDCDTTSCCNQMTRILVVNYPTCGNNGKLILERTSVECGNNNQPSSCSVVWKDNTDRVLGNSFELNNLSAGRYYAEVTCDNGCSNVKEVILNEMPSDTEGGLLGKYYKSSSDTCNFAETNLLFDRIQTIDFDWEQLPDGTLNNVHAIRWTGFVKPICTGEHIFYKNTNTSGRLYINGELLINENNQDGNIVLQSENTYTVVYELINFIPNNTRVKLEWAMPCDSTRQKIDACFLKPDPLKGLAPTGCPTPDFCPNPPCDTIPCQTPPCPVIPDEKVCPRPNVREVLPTYKEICKDGESITLNAFSDGATYLWTPGNQTTSYINVSVSGTYTVTATNWCGSTTESVTVRMLDAEKVGVENGVMSVCANKPLQLKAFGGEKYQWSPSVAFDNPASETPIVTPTNNTNYHVVITTPGGCVVEKDVTVMTKNAIMLDVETDIQGCAGDTVTLSASGADSYLWFPGDGLDCDVCSSTRYIIINNKQAFELTGYKDGCEVTKTVTVRKTVPTDSISINMTVQDSGNCEIGFEAVAPEGYTEYEWHFSDGYATTTNVNTISRTFSGYGTYSVEVTVKNNPACPTQEETYRKTITLSLEDCQCKPCN